MAFQIKINKLIFILFFGTFTLLTISCEKTIEMDIKDDQRRIVVNGFLSPDQIISVNLSKSLHILDNSQFQLLNNAKVFLFKNDVLCDTFLDKGNGNYASHIIFPIINTKYKISVSCDNLVSVEASDVLPQNIPILSIDTATVMHSERNRGFGGAAGSPQKMLQCKIKFQDIQGMENYYSLLIENQHINPYFGNSSKSMIGFSTDDPSIEDAYSAYGTPFSDALFDGRNYELIIYLYKQETSYVFINLYSVSKSYYLYLKSYIKYQSSFGDVFSEPVMIYNNISNGLGIFAGYSKSTDSLLVPGNYKK